MTDFSAMAYATRTNGVRLVEVAAVEGAYPFYGTIRYRAGGALGRTRRITARCWSIPRCSPPSTPTPVTPWRWARPASSSRVRSAITRAMPASAPHSGPGSSFRPGTSPTPTCSPSAPGPSTAPSSSSAPGEDPDAVAREFRSAISAERARLRTVAEDERELKSFMEQLGRYLGLVALVALLLGGLAVGSAVQVFIRQKRETIAVLRCLGATTRQLFAVYLLQAAAMGLRGQPRRSRAAGVLLQMGLPRLLSRTPAARRDGAPGARAPLPRASASGSGSRVVFALLPLLGIRKVAPLAVLRRPFEDEAQEPARSLEPGPGRRGARGQRLRAGRGPGPRPRPRGDLRRRRGRRRCSCSGSPPSDWSAGSGAGSRSRLAYVWRQGLANLYRPANQTVLVILALGFGGFLLTTVAVVQQNLLSSFNLDRSPDRPNLVFFDIQPDQLAGLEAMLARRQHPLPRRSADRADAHPVAQGQAGLPAAGRHDLEGKRRRRPARPLGPAARIPLDLSRHHRGLGKGPDRQVVGPAQRRPPRLTGAGLHLHRHGTDLGRSRTRGRTRRRRSAMPSSGTCRDCRSPAGSPACGKWTGRDSSPTSSWSSLRGPLDRAPQMLVTHGPRRRPGHPGPDTAPGRRIVPERDLDRPVADPAHHRSGSSTGWSSPSGSWPSSAWRPVPWSWSVPSPPAAFSGSARESCSGPWARPARQVTGILAVEYATLGVLAASSPWDWRPSRAGP